MVVLNGKSVFGGIAIGKLFIHRKKNKYIKCLRIDDTNAETEKFETAKKIAISQLDDLYQKALLKVGKNEACIFEIQKMMIEDVDFCASVINIIKSKHFNAEYAVFKTAEKFSHMIASMDDEYIRGRATDVMDVSRRLLNIMTQAPCCPLCKNEPVIIGTDDLAPSEIVQLDKNMVLGFVTSHGSSCSHTAILARTMNIPAVTNIGNILRPEFDGATAIVDGFDGKVYINPDEKTMYETLLKIGDEITANIFLPEIAPSETIALGEQKIEICTNSKSKWA
jgi:phosphotransferase system enzyme I (PtsI)